MKKLFVLLYLLVFAQCAYDVKNDGFEYVFDGVSLDDWEYDVRYWRVEDSMMVGETTLSVPLAQNTFIIRKDLILGDFELKVDYRVSEMGNSGISYRNEMVDTLSYTLQGYQADIDGRNLYTGQNYEDRGRIFLALRGQKNAVDADYISPSHAEVNAVDLQSDTLLQYIHTGWNEYHIIVRSNRLQHYINGVLMSEVIDDDTLHRRMTGLLGVQLHTGPPMKIELKNFRVKSLD